MTPDPARDVMVYQVTMIDGLSGVSIGDRWSVWAGSDNEGSFDTEAEAVMVATQLARDHGRPAWLVRENGPTTAL